MIFTYERKIFGYECDIYGHLNNAYYQHILEEGRSDALDKMEISLDHLKSQDISIYLRKIEINYLKGIAFGSKVVVKTYIKEFSRLKSTWIQEIRDESGILCSTAVVEGVFAKDNKPFRISRELEQRFLVFCS